MKQLWHVLLFALAAGLLPGQPLSLSLSKAVEIATAKEGSRKLQIIREAVAQSEARRRQAFGAFLPNLDGSLGASSQTRNLAAGGFNVSLPIPGVSIPRFVGPFTVVDFRATASQSILDLSAIRRYRAAQALKSAAEADSKRAEDQTIEQVARAYVLALRAEAAVVTAESNVELAKRLVKLAEAQKSAGTGTGIEVTRARVQLENEQQRLLASRNDRERGYLELKRAIGMDLGQMIVLPDRLDRIDPNPPTLEDSLKAGLAERADLWAQTRRETAAHLTQSSVRSERYPSLGASGDYGVIGDGSTMLPTRSVSISMRVPLFDGGRREARIAETGVQARQERLRLEDLRQQVELEIRLALNNWKNAVEQMDSARQGLGLAENELAQSQRRYEAGVASSVELTDAQTRLARARDNDLSATYQFNLARIDLAAATGAISGAVKRMTQP